MGVIGEQKWCQEMNHKIFVWVNNEWHWHASCACRLYYNGKNEYPGRKLIGTIVDWMIFTLVNHPEGNKPTFRTVCCQRVRRSFSKSVHPFLESSLTLAPTRRNCDLCVVICGKESSTQRSPNVKHFWALSCIRCAVQNRLCVYVIAECDRQVLAQWLRNCKLIDRLRTILVEIAATEPCKIHTRHLSWKLTATCSMDILG